MLSGSMRKGGVANFVRGSCVALLMAASVPAPAYSASPKKAVDCEAVTGPERVCALRDPMEYLNVSQAINRKSWAKEYWVAAYMKNPQAVLCESKRFSSQPYYREVVLGAFRWAAQNDPSVVFLFSGFTENGDSPNSANLLDLVCRGQPQLRDGILLTATRQLAKVDPIWAIAHCKDLSNSKGEEMDAMLEEAASMNPSAVFDFRDRVHGCLNASPMFLKAVQANPDLALNEPGAIFNYEWSREMIFASMERNPRLALLNLSKFRGWPFYKGFQADLIRLLYSKHYNFLFDNMDLVPNGLEKEMVLARMKAEMGR
jgi:hypothetical protein